MKASLFFTAFFLAAVSILLSVVINIQKETIAVVTQQQLSSLFLNYAEALNDRYLSGTPADGDMTATITLPVWQPRSSQIVVRVSGGVGYIFMPSSPGVLSQLLQDTENSAHIGLSDATGIRTPAGVVPRPSFIPAGYVVYVR
ncbi:type IV pilus biogenesis protein PilM [Rahnella sikkimica]|uniref:Oxidoreductase n=1 Tax=Rahnella sikkimica TaxID=1805933 RepID=A0A2L1UZ85_9GAMM|nr:type IV pilus biogenesis protein PilM [Rahnella sikkimica]AVF38204.1 oxidoreductase [Rahnella sikkimica]